MVTVTQMFFLNQLVKSAKCINASTHRGVSTSTVARWPWAIPWVPPGRGSSARCWLCWRSRRHRTEGRQGPGLNSNEIMDIFRQKMVGSWKIHQKMGGLRWFMMDYDGLRWIMMALTQLKPVRPGQCSACNLQSGTKGRWCSSWVSTPHCLALEDKQVAGCTSSFAVETRLLDSPGILWNLPCPHDRRLERITHFLHSPWNQIQMFCKPESVTVNL